MKNPLLLAAALVLLAFPALAQSVTADVPATWWSTLVAGVTSALEPIAIAALTALGGYVLTRVSSWLTGKISDQARNRILSGAAIAGNVALQQLISSSRDGKITMMEVMTAVRAGAAELMKTYSESAAKLDMTVANAERVVKDGIMNAAAQQGLTVDLTQAGTMFVVPPGEAAKAAVAAVVPGPGSGGMMRSHPVATLASIGVALALLGALLVGCGPLDKPVIKDPVSYQQHVATAETFVGAAIVIADRCVAQKIAFCVARADEIATAKTVALGALAEAKELGTDQTLGQTLLRVAMNAVLLFYSFK